MHVRIRLLGKRDTVVVVESKLTKIDRFRRILYEKFNVEPKLQRLFYGGKLLEDGYTFHDYNIKLNDVIQLMVLVQPVDNPKEETEVKTEEIKQEHSEVIKDKSIEYKDAKSTLYEVGDLIDMRHRRLGIWLEAKIIRIVNDPDIPHIPDTKEITANGAVHTNSDNHDQNCDLENDVENKPPSKSTNRDRLSKIKNTGRFMTRVPIAERKKQIEKQDRKTEEPKDMNKAEVDLNSLLLYKVQLETDDEEADVLYCKLKEIRPRARTEIKPADLKVGQKVMVNYNIDHPLEKGCWYDFQVAEVNCKYEFIYYLKGTLYLGPDAVPQNDTKVKVRDKIFAIEEVVPLGQRTEESMLMVSTVPKRSAPLHCLKCRDEEGTLCSDCGCYLCSGKEFPDKILLCDECDRGYHMHCLDPPLTELPEDDWYCPSCKRDPNDVVAPGAAKQTKKTSTSKRDWGRGMACVGKTKTSAMPANYFGPIPGIEVGMCWKYRIQLSETGVHRPPVSGIHGRDVEGAYSIVLSGGYEDDVDNGYEFTYTGSGGRDLSGNKRTAEQCRDQILTRENKALARSCAVSTISEEGGDAGEDWRKGKPVRVVRSWKMLIHFPKYAPKEGIRYDGIYKVVKYYPEKGLSGYRVWKYLLRRDDPNPAPWEPGVTEYPIIYPDGYLEAEAEKEALKKKKVLREKKAPPRKKALTEKQALAENNSKNGKVAKGKIGKGRKRRVLWDTNITLEDTDISEESPPVKKQKPKEETKIDTTVSLNETPSTSTENPGQKMSDKELAKNALSEQVKEAIKADTLNSKFWEECLVVCETRGKKEFFEHVTQVFQCIICKEIAVCPVTTPCLHNFCVACLKLATRASCPQCPYCRQSLANFKIEINELLKTALRSIMAGYDVWKK